MKVKKRATTFRLHPKVIKKIKELADSMELSQAGIIELAISKLGEDA